MVKIEGMAGIKLTWLIKQLSKDLEIADESIIKRAFVETIFANVDYNTLLDTVADYITDNYDLD